ncbi:hypothetical protein OG785_36800 [Streptomyces sp. NBC_00006]|uniref:hypothetical protein n=1 Tax=Streptomyces sp. NBC_00006 TaxID=2975619 RepID=UPI00224DBE05|nr:hypothetical protein [Streptomyces sp. NBC_00006]MCX5536103.1 hypothetical protein [Streptomyces sp. NBC_00006]
MHAIRAASAAALSLAALSLAATPVAANDSSFNVTVTPSTIAAGGRVTLQASGCDEPRDITVEEGILRHVSFSGSGSGNADVDWDAQQGAVRSVKFVCGESSDTVTVTIATGRPDSSPSPVPQGVKAGIGGSAGGLDLQEVALGGALIAGALGTAYVVARRRTGDKSA